MSFKSRGGGKRGLLGTFQIWASGMLPPKLRHILGCLAFSEKFVVKKKSLRRSNHFLKIQLDIHFWLFLIVTTRFKKNQNRNMDILFLNLLSESILDFGKWSNWKYTYTRTRVFSVWPLPEVQNWFWKQIWNENIHISFLIFFLKRFDQYLKKNKKNGFPIVLSKSNLTGVGSMCWWFFLKAKNPNICLCLGGSMPEAQIKQCPLTPSPIIRTFVHNRGKAYHIL